ncbi:chitin deacetylase [Mortierella sp. NVP85]|nr:chitin deacetylase [Mortierella sp. NVP85]
MVLVLSIISSNNLIDAGPDKAVHKPDWSHPKGTSPWPEYGERPDTDTPEVKAWVKLVDWSKVPKLPIGRSKSLATRPSAPVTKFPQAINEWGLTFDDDPQPGTTEKLLGLLKEKDATATFFMTGMKSAKAPWLLQETVDQGRHLASHTWSRSGMTTLTNEEIVAELKWTEKYIYDHTGYKVKYFRPPYNDVDNRVRAIARELGFRTVNGIHMIGGGEHDLSQGYCQQLQEGSSEPSQRDNGVITLEHDGDPKMTVMAPTLLDMGIAKGLKPMHIAQCLGDQPESDASKGSQQPSQPQQLQQQKPTEQKSSNEGKDKATDTIKSVLKSGTESSSNDPSVAKEVTDSKTKASGSSRLSRVVGVAGWAVMVAAASLAF